MSSQKAVIPVSKPKPKIWEASDTPEEDWGDCPNEDGQWPVDGIVSEEIDLLGTSRYEVRWKNWSRPDGTNTTYMKFLPELPDLVESWRRKQSHKRRKRAERTLSVEMEPFATTEGHRRRTVFTSQAMKEKLEKSRREGGLDKYRGWSSIDEQGKDKAKGRETSSQVLLALSSPRNVAKNSEGRHAWGFPQGEWNSVARDAGAASIMIVNDVDDERDPPVIEGFIYLEREYMYNASIQQTIATSKPYRLSCKCLHCKDAGTCDCQDVSELVDQNARKIYAYNKKGFFTFDLPPGVEVIECNENCTCFAGGTCYNRVAQTPRDVPIEIFKTVTRGWGARATVDLQKGKVVGIYTGKVISRDGVENVPEAYKPYTFDLDAREYGAADGTSQIYSVEAYAQGNWTRFINHSCEPNLMVYPVVWDTIPEQNIPYLAFVAMMDIQSYEELTLDYNPGAAVRVKEKKRGKGKIPPDATVCECNAKNCRGWIKI